ncbi:MAG TPA: hypothetical protein VIY08_11870 [Candidatus Nitrosocosmicus sp.]
MSSINANQSTNSNLMNNSNCKNPDTESCYNSGYSDGKINPMTTCPEGYSKTYCNGYNMLCCMIILNRFLLTSLC